MYSGISKICTSLLDGMDEGGFGDYVSPTNIDEH